MTLPLRAWSRRRRAGAGLAVAAVVVAAAVWLAVAVGASGPAKHAPPPRAGRYLVTEYFPVPERWFVGAPVRAAGLPGKYRQDWLWSPSGLSIEFDGVALDGTRVHFANDEGITWVNAQGYPTRPKADGTWSNGQPVWRDVGWRNANGQPTFPKISGGWSNGRGVRFERSPLRFALGPSQPFLRYWHTAAVDPKVIPLGSRIYVAKYKSAPNHGWFVAQDTGSTIIGHQIDLYVPPPPTPNPNLQFSSRQQVVVYPPARR